MVETTVVTFGDIVDALDSAVIASAVPEHSSIGSVAMVGPEDVQGVAGSVDGIPSADLLLLVGVDDERVARRWADPTVPRPVGLVTKDDAVARVAVSLQIGVVTIAPAARWDRVLVLLQDRLDRAAADHGLAVVDQTTADLDLFGLVGLVAEGTGGLVSIEDPTSARVLAYSPSHGEADDLRMQTILGRSGPSEYLGLLREWGVFDAVRNGGEVVDVPEHPELNMARRLVVGVNAPSGRPLGSIWVQEGAQPLAAGSAQVLLGASAVAARILTREMQAPSTEAQLVQRLFGEHGGVDAASVGAYLRLPVDGRYAVVGLGAGSEASGPSRFGAGSEDAIAQIGGALRLEASAFAASSLTAVVGERAYLLLPDTSVNRLTRWTTALVKRFDGAPPLRGAVLRGAIVADVDGLAAVAAARAECDRVLLATGDQRVTTLAQARTAVLLGEIIGVLQGRPDLVDPRLERLRSYDEEHASSLVASLRAYLAALGNVRDAARALDIHTNTLRYRLERAQQITGLRLDDAQDRLLTALQLAITQAEARAAVGAFS